MRQKRWGNICIHDLDDQTATGVTVPKITIASLKSFFDLNLAISITLLSLSFDWNYASKFTTRFPTRDSKKCDEIPKKLG